TSDEPRHFGGNDENAGADHGSDHHHDGVEEVKAAHKAPVLRRISLNADHSCPTISKRRSLPVAKMTASPCGPPSAARRPFTVTLRTGFANGIRSFTCSSCGARAALASHAPGRAMVRM